MGAFSVFRLLRTVWTVGVSAQSCRFRIFRGFRARKRRFRHARAGFALGCSLVVCCSSRWFRALFRWCFVPIDLLRSTNAGHSVFGNFGAFCR